MGNGQYRLIDVRASVLPSVLSIFRFSSEDLVEPKFPSGVASQ